MLHLSEAVRCVLRDRAWWVSEASRDKNAKEGSVPASFKASSLGEFLGALLGDPRQRQQGGLELPHHEGKMAGPLLTLLGAPLPQTHTMTVTWFSLPRV